MVKQPEHGARPVELRPGAMLRTAAAATLLAAALFAGPAFAQPAAPVLPLPEAAPPATPAPVSAASLAELLGRAESTYPTLAAARLARQQSEAAARAAGVIPPVMINVGKHVGDDAGPDNQDVFVQGRYPLGGKRRARAQQAQRQVQVARAAEDQARVELAFRVRSAFVDFQTAAAEERLARENLELAQTFLRLTEVQFEAGEVARSTVLRAQLEAANAQQSVTAAAALAAARRAALNVLIGADPKAPLDVAPAELFPLRALDPDALRELALNRPDVRVARATLRAREAAVGLARAARAPDFTLDYAHRDLFEYTGEGNVIRGGVEWPLFDFGYYRFNRQAARAAADEQEANLNVIQLQAIQELQIAYQNLVASREQAEALGGPQLERARQLRDIAEFGYREGQFTYLEFLDAQRSYLATFTQYLRAVAAANAAQAALERSVGVGFTAPDNSEAPAPTPEGK